jgi:large repetitive protein
MQAGLFSINVPGSALAADPDATIDASVSTTDAAGNPGTATTTQSYAIDTTAPVPTISVNSVTGDNVLNAAEAGGTVAITGTVGGEFNTGDTVTLTVNGNTYTGTVDAGGLFSINVPGSALAADPDATIDASVSTTDAAGNPGTATTTQSYTVDTDFPTIIINTVAGDNIINNAEDDSPVIISGTTLNVEDGQVVTVTVNGNTYTGVVTAGIWSVSVPVIDVQAFDASELITADVSNLAGNTAPQAIGTITYDAIDPVPTISVNSVTGDNVLNAAEAGGTVAITGTVGGEFNTGDTVTLTVNGNTYTGTVDAGGLFSINVPGSALAADPDATIDASVSTTDAAGNPGTATTTQSYAIDTTAPVPTISVNSVTGDNVLNAAEAGGTVAITGTVGGEFNTGDTVTLTVNGNTYTGTVDAGGLFSINVPGSALAADPDATIDASVSTTDAAGNPGTATTTQSYAIDTTAPVPTISVNSVTGDNVLNAAEAGGTVAITGTVGGEFNTGDTVTLTVNGNTYTGTVDAGGLFSINVPGSALAADPDATIDASVSTTDAAGNPGTATTTQSYAIDTTAPVPTISVNSVTGDNVLNAAEAGGTVAITGTVGGEFNTGDTVTLTVNGNTYTGTVDAGGLFSINVPGSALAADPDATIDASVSTTDAAGNPGTATTTQSYAIDTTAPVPTISVNSVTGDNVLNAAEAGGTVAITGTVGGEFNTGDTVTLTVNGNTYTGTVDAGGLFSINVPGSALAADPDATIDASVSTTDAAGNPGTATTTQSYAIDTTAPVPTISVNSVTGDNVLNAAEAGGTVAITGTVGGEFNTGDTVTLTVNGNTYTGTVDAGGLFSINVPGSALAADPDATIDASVSTTDAAGNPGTATTTQSYAIDTTAPVPTISVNSVTGDNVLNAAEAGGTVAITGTVGGEFNTGDTSP